VPTCRVRERMKYVVESALPYVNHSVEYLHAAAVECQPVS
jgi:hypothetical protein